MNGGVGSRLRFLERRYCGGMGVSRPCHSFFRPSCSSWREVSGAVVAVGLKYGCPDPRDKDAKRICGDKTGEFLRLFRARFTHLACRDLLGCAMPWRATCSTPCACPLSRTRRKSWKTSAAGSSLTNLLFRVVFRSSGRRGTRFSHAAWYCGILM